MPPALPTADPASPWTLRLERAHALAHVAARAIGLVFEPNAHLGPAALCLEQGLASLYDAFDGRADGPTAISVARLRFWEAAILVARGGLPGALAALHGACKELGAAEERLPRVAFAVRLPLPLCAGDDLPPLHTIERASLAPTFRAPLVPEPETGPPVLALPEPTTFEELGAVAAAARRIAEGRAAAMVRAARRPPAEQRALPAPEDPPPGFAQVPPPAMTEDDFIRHWARECIDDIGMLGLQRAPLPGDSFRACLALERRMVKAVDALAAFGPVAVAYVERYAMDAPAADPMRIFAMAMIGGCLEGRDVLAGAERVLHRFGAGDPPVAGGFASAMKIAPNPFVPNVLRTLYASTDPACRAIAVEVLGHRGWLTTEELGVLAHEEEPRVFALALPALAAARDRNLGHAVTRALAHADLRVQEAALDAMAIAAHPRAAEAAREAACDELGDRALVRLAIVSDEEDARWLLARMRARPTAAAVEAVGWAGLVEAVPALLGLLEGDDQEVQLAAGAALDRLLGANLVDKIEVLPEALEDVEVTDPDPEPLAALVSTPEDQPAVGSPETLDVPSIDPARWRAYWAEHGRRYDPKQRLRRGNPYSPSVSLYELDRLPLGPEDRRRLHRELCARTGKVTHFDPSDFVSVQERSLAAWGALVRATGEAPGSWGRPKSR
jgi:HEAT repeat protein